MPLPAGGVIPINSTPVPVTGKVIHPVAVLYPYSPPAPPVDTGPKESWTST